VSARYEDTIQSRPLPAYTVETARGRKTHVALIPAEGKRTLCGHQIRTGWAGGGKRVDCTVCTAAVRGGNYALRPGAGRRR
jgi:hypothetical protein